MPCSLSFRFAAVCLALMAVSGCGGASGRPEPGWPPEEPRQPERLALVAPDLTDPLEWWRTNICTTMPADVYARPEWAEAAQTVVEATNQVREQHGLEPVVRLSQLDRVAQAHARDQATRDYWSHWTPEGLGSGKRIQAASGRVIVAGGENSSVAIWTSHTPGLIVRGWLGHPGHRELLLSPEVRQTGVGVYAFGPGEWTYYVQLLVDLPDG